MTPRAPVSSSQPQRVVRLAAVSSSDYYDAAATTRDADFGSFSSALGEDSLFTGAVRQRVIGRIRRETRNNPYLAGLVGKYPEAIGHTALRSRTSSPEYNQAKELFWYRLTKRITWDGRSLRKVERIVVVELLMAGEIFLILLANGRIQLVASEFCGSPSGGISFLPGETNGIVVDPVTGAPAFYRFGRATRYGTVEFSGTDAELVPARNVIHVYDPDRVVQGRGLPWLLPSIKTARDLYEITRSKTKQIKDANSISGFIEKQGAAEFLSGLSTIPSLDSTGTTTPETTDSPADQTTTAPGTVELSPGMFVGLEPGEKVNALLTKYEATDYKELIMLMLHAISSPVGLPVELWFSGLGDVNYSGFKGLGVQWKSRREYVQAFLEESFLDRLQFWRISKAAKEGDLPPNPDRDDDLIAWGWKRAAVLDDEKAAKANEIRLRTGERSLADVWEENGQFSEEVLAHRRELWLKLRIAAGELDPAADHSAEKVPIGFLLRNELPDTTAYPFLPDGTGTDENGATRSGAAATAPPGDSTTTAHPDSPDETDQEDSAAD